MNIIKNCNFHYRYYINIYYNLCISMLWCFSPLEFDGGCYKLKCSTMISNHRSAAHSNIKISRFSLGISKFSITSVNCIYLFVNFFVQFFLKLYHGTSSSQYGLRHDPYLDTVETIVPCSFSHRSAFLLVILIYFSINNLHSHCPASTLASSILDFKFLGTIIL